MMRPLLGSLQVAARSREPVSALFNTCLLYTSGSLIRLDCRSLEYQYFPFKPEGYRLVLLDSVVKHELASSAYNKRRQSCEAAVAAIQKKHPHVEFLRCLLYTSTEGIKAQEEKQEEIKVKAKANKTYRGSRANGDFWRRKKQKTNQPSSTKQEKRK